MPIVQGTFRRLLESAQSTQSDCEQEGKVKEALEKYLQVLKVYDFRPDVTYYAALCHYNVRHFDSALALLDQVINEAHAEYPEFKSDAATTAEDDQQQSVFVENSHTLHKTFLCEAYNLKICIYFAQKNCTVDMNASRYHLLMFDL